MYLCPCSLYVEMVFFLINEKISIKTINFTTAAQTDS
jgi:hypothetical protein